MILHTKKSGIITGWPPCKNYDNVVVRRPLSVLNQFKEYIETPHMCIYIAEPSLGFQNFGDKFSYFLKKLKIK